LNIQPGKSGEENTIKRERRFRPAQFLALAFLGAISIGTLVLLCPFCLKSGSISFIDALFTSTSAVCVTGLIVQDTASCFTTAGQVVLLILFQLGGLGIMTFSTLVLLVAGKKISIKDRIIIQEGFHHSSMENVSRLIKHIFLFSITIELIGALFLFVRWQSRFSPGRAVFQSLFHSISAFCNAGFSLFSRSFESYLGDIWINGILMILIVFGGMGFLVLHESLVWVKARVRRHPFHFSLHTKMVLSLTLFLIGCSFFLFLVLENGRSLQGFDTNKKLLASLFQVVTARTAGFNTMNLGAVSHAGVYLLLILMFIGASPGSTGGGIKTSTVGVLTAYLRSKVRAREVVHAFRRTLTQSIVVKAFTVLTLALCVICVSSFLVFAFQPGLQMRDVFFEVISAFGTVGLSMGLTPQFSTLNKIVIILTMYVGRIGPLTLLLAFSRERAYGKYAYVEESVMIG
jgi:trk system potassium uptake protein TrkH